MYETTKKHAYKTTVSREIVSDVFLERKKEDEEKSFYLFFMM